MLAYREGNKLTAKHIVEEAMTKALVRKCNKCNKPFLKEGGCNRVKCECGNLNCYVCESDVVDYSHFDNPQNGKECPLYGDMQELLKKQVAVAQERTVRGLLKERSDLEDDDVRVDKEAGTYDIDNNSDLDNSDLDNSVMRYLPPGMANRVAFDPQPARIHYDHEVWHELYLGHRCYPCNKDFGSAHSLSQHRSAKHIYQLRHEPYHRGHRCGPCNTSFGSAHLLFQHQSAKHTQCHICQRSFRLPHSLDQHLRAKHGL